MENLFCALLCGSLMAANVLAADNILPYGLKSGKPYAGTTLNILSVVTPQFKAYELRDEEFESLTGDYCELDSSHSSPPSGEGGKCGCGS